jgi:hypothetical protein
VIYDNTTHRQGSMKASLANGFAQVKFDPAGTSCTSLPYPFHPMYATSGPHTRVPWAAHSYNAAFADEIGHWDYCSTVDPITLDCTQPGVNEPDDAFCFDSTSSSRVKVGGCLLSDADFDGVCYNNTWPGTNSSTDAKFHPQPVKFTSPLYNPQTPGPLANFEMQVFEADMPAIEPKDTCDRSTGTGCVNPPTGAQFYPFFSIGNERNGACTWRLGGANVVGSTDSFNGTMQYGNLLSLLYPDVGGGTMNKFEDFRSDPISNPCNAPLPSLTLPTRPISFGTVRVGRTSGIRVLRIANPTSIPIQLGALTVPSDYQIVAGKATTCPNTGVLAPGGRCQYALTLKPSAPGPDNGTAMLSSNASNASSVSLVGNGR